MKLSELIATLQATLEANGDTDEIALCFVIEGRPAHRLDVFGSVTVLHDTAEYPNGMAYLVADCNQQPARLAEGLICTGTDVSRDRLSITVAASAPTIDPEKDKAAQRIVEANGLAPSNAELRGDPPALSAERPSSNDVL